MGERKNFSATKRNTNVNINEYVYTVSKCKGTQQQKEKVYLTL